MYMTVAHLFLCRICVDFASPVLLSNTHKVFPASMQKSRHGGNLGHIILSSIAAHFLL